MSLKRVLAFDLGLHLGWAALCGPHEKGCGTLDLSQERRETLPLRVRNAVRDLANRFAPQAVVCERPHLRGWAASKTLVLSLGAVEEEAAKLGLELLPALHTGTLKKWAAGHGKASKREMIEAAQRLEPTLAILTDHEADAVCLARHALAGKEV